MCETVVLPYCAHTYSDVTTTSISIRCRQYLNAVFVYSIVEQTILKNCFPDSHVFIGSFPPPNLCPNAEKTIKIFYFIRMRGPVAGPHAFVLAFKSSKRENCIICIWWLLVGHRIILYSRFVTLSRARTFKFISHLNLFKRNKVDRICKFIRGRFQAFGAFHAHKFCCLSWLCGVQKFWVIWTPLH